MKKKKSKAFNENKIFVYACVCNSSVFSSRLCCSVSQAFPPVLRQQFTLYHNYTLLSYQCKSHRKIYLSDDLVTLTHWQTIYCPKDICVLQLWFPCTQRSHLQELYVATVVFLHTVVPPVERIQKGSNS